MDRDNVPPSYLAAVRTFVLNHTFDLLKPEDATEQWVSAALADERCESSAVKHVIKERFGDKVVAYDPADPEANKLATHGINDYLPKPFEEKDLLEKLNKTYEPIQQ